MTQAAAEKNSAIIAQAGYDLDHIIKSDKVSPLYPGSEWRPRSLLEPIFGSHPLWERAQNNMYAGALYPIEHVDVDLQQELCDMGLEFGNHKSARDHPQEAIDTLIR